MRQRKQSVFDKGVFGSTGMSKSSSVVISVPGQFGFGDWSIADAGTGGSATITIIALPDDGGSAITAIEYQIDGGAWIALVGTGTGPRTVGGFTNGILTPVVIRAVNAVGASAASTNKAITTTGS